MELILKRTSYTEKSTGGELFEGSKRICHTLEDARRLPGVKVNGETCIPAGRYRVELTHSSRFKRQMPMIYNCANGYELKAEGISFKGIRIHGGNTHKNTAGCPLVAYNRIDDNTIQGTAEKEVTALIQDALDNKREEVWIEIIDNC